MKSMRSFFLFLVAILLLGPGCNKQEKGADTKSGDKVSEAGKQITAALMPKSKGNAYFISCRKGAEQPARELSAKLLCYGPPEPHPAQQNELAYTRIPRGPY